MRKTESWTKDRSCDSHYKIMTSHLSKGREGSQLSQMETGGSRVLVILEVQVKSIYAADGLGDVCFEAVCLKEVRWAIQSEAIVKLHLCAETCWISSPVIPTIQYPCNTTRVKRLGMRPTSSLLSTLRSFDKCPGYPQHQWWF